MGSVAYNLLGMGSVALRLAGDGDLGPFPGLACDFLGMGTCNVVEMVATPILRPAPLNLTSLPGV
jgi:hypothetical protein